MSAGADRSLAESIAACGSGRFIAYLRNRPIGQETCRMGLASDGGLVLQIETNLETLEMRLTQTVAADFDRALRPERCIVVTEINEEPFELELEFGPGRVTSRCSCDGVNPTGTTELKGVPLLLVDNCFSLHALGAIVAAREARPETVFASVPAFEYLCVTVPGAGPIDLGGRRFDPPSVSLHLSPDLDEHAWFGDAWVRRLLIPQGHVRVDWIGPAELKGDRS